MRGRSLVLERMNLAARVARAARVALEAVASPLIPVICGVHRSRLAAAEESPESRAAELGAAALQAAVLREQREQSQEDGRQLRRCYGRAQRQAALAAGKRAAALGDLT